MGLERKSVPGNLGPSPPLNAYGCECDTPGGAYSAVRASTAAADAAWRTVLDNRQGRDYHARKVPQVPLVKG